MKAKYRNLWEGRYIKISKSLWFFTHLQSVHHTACRLARGRRKCLSWPKPEVSGNNSHFGKGTQPHPKAAYWEKKDFLKYVYVWINVQKIPPFWGYYWKANGVREKWTENKQKPETTSFSKGRARTKCWIQNHSQERDGVLRRPHPQEAGTWHLTK